MKLEVFKIDIIKVEGVSKTYGQSREPVINNLNFSVKKGQIVGLLGPNGCGKTTTVRLLNGVIKSDRGKIEVFGLDPTKEGDRIRSLSGVLTESAGLYPHLSGEENLSFFGALYGVTNTERITSLLKDFGLYEHRQKKVGSYSTGMKKRLGIAKALLHNPELLFLDEPTNGLDPEGARDLLGYIKRLKEEHGVTILICTHILTQIEELCDKFLFMASGTVIEEGSLLEVESKYLREFKVRVESNIKKDDLPDKQRQQLLESSENSFIFNVKTKDDIPTLLKTLLTIGPVYSCEILERDLETMYFLIREAKK